ncbi:MAG: fused MFS/spermidine synthase, partial [Myxococcota bacterium]|nr:fused MFS/spermidine synthase [Myxococcota bacterium]
MRRLAIVAFLFGLSGVAAMVYQVAWQRILAFHSGVGIDSVAVIVSAFMAGLGLGSYTGGRMSARVDAPRALVVFAGIELALGLFASLSCWFYYDLLYTRFAASYGSGSGAVLLHFLTLLPPTTLMGMSLPFLVRATVRDPTTAARTIGMLYGINVLGAAAGALLTPWVLIRLFGIEGAVGFGAACNVLAGLTVWTIGRTGGVSPEPAAPPLARTQAVEGEPAGSQPFALWVALYALSGFCALGLEILWFRIVDVAVKSTAFTFGTVLAFYLVGLGAGSIVGGRVAVRLARPLETFLTLQCGLLAYAALALVVLVALPEETPSFTGLIEYWRAYSGFELGGSAEWKWILGLYVGLPLFLYGPPTFLMGLSFGVLQRAVQDDVQTSGLKVGVLQAANIAGNVLGSLLTGLLLLGWLGTSGSFRLLLVVGVVFGVLGVRHYGARGRFGVLAVVLALLVFLVPDGERLWNRLHGDHRGRVLFEEDGTGVAAITPDGGKLRLSVNGKGHSWLPFGNMHSILGALPAALHPDPIDVAIVGLGSGDTAWAAGFREATRHLVVYEIVAPEKRLLERLASPAFPQLRRFLRDPRLDLRIADGRNALLNDETSYDVIEADALRPRSAYAGNLYSVEFFRLAAQRLKPGGLMCTWAPTPRVRAAFLSVFPNVVEFQRGKVLVGSLEQLDFGPDVWAERLQRHGAREYLGSRLAEKIAHVVQTARSAEHSTADRVEVN